MGVPVKPIKVALGQRITNDARIPDYDPGFGLSLIVFPEHDSLIHAILATMGFIRHNHNVAAGGQRFFTFLKLEHRREDDAICGPVSQKLLQMCLAFSLHRRLPQETGALGELSVKLVV